MRADIKDLMENNLVCVLATVSGDSPHCSLMSYATDADCREIYMVSHKNTKKYQNLTNNPAVSLLIDSRETSLLQDKKRPLALTVTGIFQKDVPEGKKQAIRELLRERHPELYMLLDDRDAEIVVVKIKALQLLDGICNAYFESVP
ncbi:MAG TPA: pyridoxamine 5'-phosphate oxidase family protein [Smithellaceae bacterium]|nr:pyridoxamine 5'-phosphate oxidase family protein [Smithellaceae bacterium]HRV26564.1 pyridoxamine 5'-phosphate oxidase family protein [Smithellaceae bacterium]